MGLKPKPPTDLKSVNAAVLGRVLGISRASIANLATDGILPRAESRAIQSSGLCPGVLAAQVW